MSWPRKHVAPQVLQILMLVIAVAVAGDDFVVQNVSLNATPTLQQALCNDDDPSDDELHAWEAFPCLLGSDTNPQLLYIVIRHYLAQFDGNLIQSPPSIFFQPDRAPPASFR